MENLFVLIDDNDILNETCPCGGSHSLSKLIGLQTLG